MTNKNTVHSMTAFAREDADGDWGNATWEIRSVNNRYLDINLRLPEDLRGLESRFRDMISKKLHRGKVDCTLKFTPASQQEAMQVNIKLVEELTAACRQIAQTVHETAPPNPLEVLNWPGVQVKQDLDMETATQQLSALLDKTIDILIETRAREGQKMAELIDTRCQAANKEVSKIRQRMPEIIQALSTKLHNRVEELTNRLDETRMEQEIALLAQKMDVEEELDRLDTHLSEIQRVLQQPEPIGRRLDFLMQEMNREANTLGSKSAHIDSTETSIELKVLIEQMREQIQNIE